MSCRILQIVYTKTASVLSTRRVTQASHNILNKKMYITTPCPMKFAIFQNVQGQFLGSNIENYALTLQWNSDCECSRSSSNFHGIRNLIHISTNIIQIVLTLTSSSPVLDYLILWRKFHIALLVKSYILRELELHEIFYKHV